MGPHQSKKKNHVEINYQQNENMMYGTGENIFKYRLNIENI